MNKKHNSKKRFENREHLEMIASMQCMMRTFGCSKHEKGGCCGPTQAHHLLKPWDGTRGMGMRSNDRNVIPLCQNHHSLLHTKYGSEKSFFTAYGMPENMGKKIAQSLYKTGVSSELDDNSPF